MLKEVLENLFYLSREDGTMHPYVIEGDKPWNNGLYVEQYDVFGNKSYESKKCGYMVEAIMPVYDYFLKYYHYGKGCSTIPSKKTIPMDYQFLNDFYEFLSFGTRVLLLPPVYDKLGWDVHIKNIAPSSGKSIILRNHEKPYEIELIIHDCLEMADGIAKTNYICIETRGEISRTYEMTESLGNYTPDVDKKCEFLVMYDELFMGIYTATRNLIESITSKYDITMEKGLDDFV